MSPKKVAIMFSFEETERTQLIRGYFHFDFGFAVRWRFRFGAGANKLAIMISHHDAKVKKYHCDVLSRIDSHFTIPLEGDKEIVSAWAYKFTCLV